MGSDRYLIEIMDTKDVHLLPVVHRLCEQNNRNMGSDKYLIEIMDTKYVHEFPVAPKSYKQCLNNDTICYTNEFFKELC